MIINKKRGKRGKEETWRKREGTVSFSRTFFAFVASEIENFLPFFFRGRESFIRP